MSNQQIAEIKQALRAVMPTGESTLAGEQVEQKIGDAKRYFQLMC